MLSKIQKIWMWIFIAMFALPEILFFTTPSLMQSILGESFLKLSSPLINYSVFFAHPYYLLIIIFVEWLGILGLSILIIKSGKKILVIVPFLILIWLSFIFCLFYVTGISMNF